MAGSRSPAKTKSPSPRADPLEPRLALLRERMAALRLDAYLLTHAADIAHVTGFSGHDSAAIVSARGVTMVTDSRYSEELATDAPQAKAVIRKNAMTDALAAALGSAIRIGFESNFVTFGTIDGIRAQLKKLRKPGKLIPIADLMIKLRAVKDASEVAAIGRAIDIAQSAFTKVVGKIRPGVTEGAVAGQLILEMRSRGATDAAFQPIIAAGAHGSLPHYRPDATVITANAPLLIDWGAIVDGYRSDLTRTMLIGKVHRKMEEIYKVTLDANVAAIAALKPGMTGKEADAVARKLITKAGYGKQFGHGLGHGIGRDIHEEPRLHYSREKETLVPGMIVTVEPGIYLPGIGGVRIEDDVRITETGCEVLTSLDKSLQWAKTFVG
jgi:Xaa-Pro aminopeptidase